MNLIKVLGLDVSKSTASYWLLSSIPENPKRFARKTRETKLKVCTTDKDSLVLLDFDFAVLEPSGVYSRIWRHWLRETGKEYRLVSHSALANYRSDRKLQKTDKLDALALAMYGLERAEHPEAWITEVDYTLSDAVLLHHHCNQQKNGFQNNLKQRLAFQVPEWDDKQIKREWASTTVPGILKAIAGSPSKKWAAELEATCGVGLKSDAAALARILIQIELEEIELEQQIETELSKPHYAPYLAAAEAASLSRFVAANLIASVFPFQQFLDDGKPRITRTLSKEKGLPVKKDESLRAFKLACGMGLIWHQSGKYTGWVAGGDATTRTALHNAVRGAYMNNKKKQKNGKPSDPVLDEIPHKYHKQAIMRASRKWVERFYRELLKQQCWK